MKDFKKLFLWICVCWTFISTTMPFLAPEVETPVEVVTKTVLFHHTDYVEVYVEQTPYFHVTSVEREMLARLLWTEARGESIECQRAIISVVMNRVKSDAFPNTIAEVITQKTQFDFGNKLGNITPNETQYEAVDYVIMQGCTVPEWVQYFRSDYHFNWRGYSPYAKIDQTCFGGYKGA